MIDCNGCYLNRLYESDDERLMCLHRNTCERAYQQGKADSIIEALEPYDAESIDDLVHNAYRKGRNDAIDEFADYIEAAFLYSNFYITDVRPMAEQLKEQKNE